MATTKTNIKSTNKVSGFKADTDVSNFTPETKVSDVKADVRETATDARAVASNAAGKVAEGTREFMRRSAATAKDRSDAIYEGSETVNDTLENAMTKVVGGYVSILGGMARVAHANVNRALTTVEKLANAQSVSEAVRIQTDYIRENTSANFAEVRNAAGTTREVLGDGVDAAREQASKMWPYGKKAA